MSRETAEIMKRVSILDKKYKEFREFVVIHNDDLDHELTCHPQISLDVGEVIAKLSFFRSRIKRHKEEAEASAWLAIARESEGKKRTIAEMEREVTCDTEVGGVVYDFDKVSEVLDRWVSLRNSLIDKVLALRHLSGLLQGGHFPDVSTTGSKFRDRNA